MNKTKDHQKKLTLVVLAAGMGSRYGGLKQIDTFTSQKDTIIDFSLYDAIKSGFEKVVFVIRKNFETEFKVLFEKKLKGKVEVVYTYQEIDTIPETYQSIKRTKPWGTGHALLMVKDVVKENFAIINADDFYSREAFEVMAKELTKTNKYSYDFSMVAYQLKNTVSDNGYVSRGECSVNERGCLTCVTEREHIEKKNGKLYRKDSSGNQLPIDENVIVSMNFWGFTPKCFEFCEQLFEQFLQDNKHRPKAEFYLPTIVNEALKSGKAKVKVLQSSAKWFGVTYSTDKEKVQKAIAKLKNNGTYPEILW